jgi:hypothetical protein
MTDNNSELFPADPTGFKNLLGLQKRWKKAAKKDAAAIRARAYLPAYVPDF